MFGFFKKRVSVKDTQDYLSQFLVEDAIRSSKGFLDAIWDLIEEGEIGIKDSDFRFLPALEFLIFNVHFVERKLYWNRIRYDFDEFMQPIRLDSLVGLITISNPEDKDIERYIDIWSNAANIYFTKDVFYAPPAGQDFKKSATGECAKRIAALYNESEYSFVAKTAAFLIASKIAEMEKQKIIDSFFEATNWRT